MLGSLLAVVSAVLLAASVWLPALACTLHAGRPPGAAFPAPVVTVLALRGLARLLSKAFPACWTFSAEEQLSPPCPCPGSLPLEPGLDARPFSGRALQ